MTSIHDALGRLWNANDHDRMLECDGRWASWGSVRSLTERIDRELADAGCQAGGRSLSCSPIEWSPSRRSSQSFGADARW